MTQIAVLGLGAMGSRMAARLLQAGHDLIVWNRSDSAVHALVAMGARSAETPRAAAQGADVVLAMLRDDAASAQVWLDPEKGALRGMRAGATAIESSTLTVAHVRTLAAAARTQGVAFLDAPVVGSRPQADAGQLIFLAGGDAETLAWAEPVMKGMGVAIHHVGSAGSGAALKLAVNAMFAIQVAALAETFGALDRAGVDAVRALDILGTIPVTSPAVKGAGAAMLAGNVAPQFPVDLVEKDLGYAQAVGAPCPMVDAARAVMLRAIAAGIGADNLTGIVRLYR